MAVSVAELDARLRRRRRSSIGFKAGRAVGEHGGSRPCVCENPALRSSGFKAGLIDPNAVCQGQRRGFNYSLLPPAILKTDPDRRFDLKNRGLVNPCRMGVVLVYPTD